MTPRERVIKALNHEEPDRPPMQISFTPEFANRLADALNIREEDHNPHGGGNTQALELALGQDVLLSSVGWANCYYGEEDTYTDEWGVGWRKAQYSTPFGIGHYTEIVGHPLGQEGAIDSYVAPDPDRDYLYDDARQLIERYKGEYWITGVTVTTIFETAWALRGLDQMMMDFILDPDLVNRILDIPMNYHLRAAKNLVELGVDMIWLGDDVGAQNNMMISPDMWRTFFKPRMENIVGELKAINPALKIAYHSDGNIFPIISDLIEVGIDILNPIQPASMDPAEVKERHGKELSFWGSIDEQHTLPFGTPEDVRSEVKTRLATIGKGGGLIIGPTHHVQLDTPLENFFAMVDTIREGY